MEINILLNKVINCRWIFVNQNIANHLKIKTELNILMLPATILRYIYLQGKIKYVGFTSDLSRLEGMKDTVKESVAIVMLMPVLYTYIWLKWQKRTSIW